MRLLTGLCLVSLLASSVAFAESGFSYSENYSAKGNSETQALTKLKDTLLNRENTIKNSGYEVTEKNIQLPCSMIQPISGNVLITPTYQCEGTIQYK